MAKCPRWIDDLSLDVNSPYCDEDGRSCDGDFAWCPQPWAEHFLLRDAVAEALNECAGNQFHANAAHAIAGKLGLTRDEKEGWK
jgi:hypothetical protein